MQWFMRSCTYKKKTRTDGLTDWSKTIAHFWSQYTITISGNKTAGMNQKWACLSLMVSFFIEIYKDPSQFSGFIHVTVRTICFSLCWFWLVDLEIQNLRHLLSCLQYLRLQKLGLFAITRWIVCLSYWKPSALGPLIRANDNCSKQT